MKQQVQHKQFQPRRHNRTLVITLFAGIAATGLIYAFAQRARRVAQPENSQNSSARKPATIRVKAGGNLQGAINAAQFGDTIVLDAGATYAGSFVLPYKGAGTNTDADYITITSSALASLPDGRRVSMTDLGSMPRLVASNMAGFSYGYPVIRTEARAHHYKLVGLALSSEPSAFLYSVVSFGDGSEAQNSLSLVPHHLTLDRCLVYAGVTQPAKMGIALNSSDTTITNSYLAGFKLVGQDAQAICMWNGPGRYLIENNYIEGAANNILILGSSNWIPGLIPSDIMIRRNHLSKPLSWKPDDASYAGTLWVVKNLLELKTGKRVVIDGNLIENVWTGEQGGTAVGFAPISNGSGSVPQLEDITFTNNVVRHAAGGVWVDGRWEAGDGSYLRRAVIRNNVFEDIDGRWGDNYGRLFVVNDWTENVLIEHNTALNGGAAVYSHVGGNSGFISRNNLFRKDVASGLASGEATMKQLFPGGIWTRNVQIGAEAGLYNSSRGNFFLPTAQAVGFVDLAGGNYRLAQSSRYKRAATDGKDIGCDIDALEAAQSKSK